MGMPLPTWTPGPLSEHSHAFTIGRARSCRYPITTEARDMLCLLWNLAVPRETDNSRTSASGSFWVAEPFAGVCALLHLVWAGNPPTPHPTGLRLQGPNGCRRLRTDLTAAPRVSSPASHRVTSTSLPTHRARTHGKIILITITAASTASLCPAPRTLRFLLYLTTPGLFFSSLMRRRNRYQLCLQPCPYRIRHEPCARGTYIYASIFKDLYTDLCSRYTIVRGRT